MIPLRYRLPNPPGLFFGRATELARLAVALERDRCVCIWGAGGIGKSTLVYSALEEKRSVIYIELGATRGPLLDMVSRALRATLGYEQLRGDVARRDPGEMLADVLDMADAQELCVVLDDAHVPSRDDVDQLVAACARYARRSRWIFISRRELDARSTLHLGPMSLDAMYALADALAQSSPAHDVQRAARAFAGSPWRLIQAMRHGHSLEDAGSSFEDLAPTARHAVILMTPFENAIPKDALADIGVDHDTIQLLLDSSLASTTIGGVKLHDMTRETFRVERATWLEHVPAMLQALESHNDSFVILERARLACALEDDAHLITILENHSERLFDQGYAPEVWDIVVKLDTPALRPWRLTCARVHGTPDAFDAVAELELDDLAIDARLARLHIWYERGQFARVATEARALVESVQQTGDLSASMEARQLWAVAMMFGGEFDACQELLDAMQDATGRPEEMRRVIQAMLSMRFGDLARAREERDALDKRLDELSGRQRASLVYNLCLIEYRLQELGAARERFERELATDPIALTIFAGRKALMLGAALAFHAADADSARDLLDRIATIRAISPVHRVRYGILENALSLMVRGDARADEILSLAHEASSLNQWEDATSAISLLAQRALVTAEDVKLPSFEGAPVLPSTIEANILTEQSMIRHGHAPTELEMPAGVGQKLTLMAEHTDIMARASEPTVLDELLALYERAREAGLIALSLDILVTGCLRGAYLDDTRFADILCEVATPALPRYASLAMFWRAAHNGDASELLALSSSSTYLPADVEARRYIGGVFDDRSAQLDAWERDALEQVRQRASWRGERVGHDGAVARWVNTSTCDVLGDDIDAVSLARHVTLWKLLEELLRRGQASKEELILAVWEVPEYHPLQHDNRLRLAARKLRKLVEARPNEPRWIITTDDGYRVGTPTWVVRA